MGDIVPLHHLSFGGEVGRRPGEGALLPAVKPVSAFLMTEVLIDSIGQHGDGIAEVSGERVFVPFTLPGERVEIAREGERATLLRIIEPSAERAEPSSP